MIHALALLLLDVGGGNEPQDKKAKPTGFTWEWRARAELAYDSNIWLLESTAQERLRDHERGGPPGSPPDDDETSGRYEDMERVDDFILAPSLSWEATGRSPLGRRYDFLIGVEIPVYFQNMRRSHLDFDLGLGQAVGADGRLGLAFQFIPEYFRKNYLADAVEVGVPNGDIQRNERIYEDGTYREFEIALEYRHKLIDRTQSQPFGLTGAIEFIYADRSYDSPLTYRDETATGIRLGLGFQYGPRVKWGLHYQYVAADSPSESHIVLINEFIYGNQDGFAAIVNNARTNQIVDRTHNEHEFGLSVGVELSDKFEVELVYEQLRREFESDNRLDVEHFGREDVRDSIQTGLIYKLGKAWQGRLGYLRRVQESDLDDPEAGDDGDYKRYVFYASLTYHW